MPSIFTLQGVNDDHLDEQNLREYEDDFQQGMADALWIDSYASFIEELKSEGEDVDDLPHPGGGEAWEDYAPSTPDVAMKAAKQLGSLFAADNDIRGMWQLAARAKQTNWSEKKAHEFGWLMAMQAMGHGVSWFDDHKKFPVVFPYFEAHYFEPEFLWSGRAKSGLAVDGSGRVKVR